MRTALIALLLAAALAWPLLASLTDAGLGMDPDGQPGGCTVTSQTDEGLGMDPDGRTGS